MRKRVLLWSVVLLAGMVATTGYSQPAFKLDLDGSVASPNTVTQNTTVAVNATVTAHVILTGAVNMLGANADLNFPNNLLALQAITEQVGDLNFDGIAALADVLTEVSRFGQTNADPNWFSYYDREVVATPNVIALADILSVVSGFGIDTEFWTNNLGRDLSAFGGFRESVEIYDPVATSNAAGKVDDIVSVLLARPDVRANPTLLNQFAFSGDAVMAELQFSALAAGVANLTFAETVMLDTDDDPASPTPVGSEGSSITIQ